MVEWLASFVDNSSIEMRALITIAMFSQTIYGVSIVFNWVVTKIVGGVE